MPKEKAQKVREELFQAVVEEAGDKEPKSKYFRYQDSRDEGFVFSFKFRKEKDYAQVEATPDAFKNERGEIDDQKIPYTIGTADGEANLHAPHALGTIAEHFPYVIEDFENLEGQDSRHRDKEQP
jgi:hypothetical protein